MIRVNLTTGECSRQPIPQGIPLGNDVILLDLTWTGWPSLIGIGWWPEDSQKPQLELYQHYDVETLTPDFARKVVVATSTVKPWTAEEIAAYKKPIQDSIWNAIKSERDGVAIAGGRSDGGVLVAGNWFHSDIISRVKWLGLKDSARDQLKAGGALEDAIVIDGEPILWKTMASDFVPVSVQLAIDVVAAIKALDVRMFKVAEQHRAALVAAHDPAFYDYTAGWPLRYVDTLNDPAELAEKIA